MGCISVTEHLPPMCKPLDLAPLLPCQYTNGTIIPLIETWQRLFLELIFTVFIIDL